VPGRSPLPSLDAAEFFAGIGLVRAALAEAGIRVTWANDIEPVKAHLYSANFPDEDYFVGDIRSVAGGDLPAIDLATASFPCTDLSLAGWRRGLAGSQSGMFWEFARIIEEMEKRRPRAVLLENVPSFATSHGGRDLHDAIERLNELGYSCDIFHVDARHFVPQSRPRLFIVGLQTPVGERLIRPDALRSRYIVEFRLRNPHLAMHAFPLHLPPPDPRTLADIVERVPPDAAEWWDERRSGQFLASLSPLQAERLNQLRKGPKTWRTAYRRTRNNTAVWEIRPDPISGCLRTARGGSSKQALVEAGEGSVRLRWMTGREYARLQGVGDEFAFDGLSRNKVMFGFGDAVCVPVVAWIACTYLGPVLANGQAQAAAG
jgi:DNA (cytosine-5)-methyltransferase 1